MSPLNTSPPSPNERRAFCSKKKKRGKQIIYSVYYKYPSPFAERRRREGVFYIDKHFFFHLNI